MKPPRKRRSRCPSRLPQVCLHGPFGRRRNRHLRHGAPDARHRTIPSSPTSTSRSPFGATTIPAGRFSASRNAPGRLPRESSRPATTAASPRASLHNTVWLPRSIAYMLGAWPVRPATATGDRVARERREQVLEPVAGRPAIGIAESDDVAMRRVDAIESVVPRFVVAGVRADLDEVDPAPAARAVIPESTARNPRRYSAASRSASRACSSARPPSRTARARTTSRRSPSRSIAASR